VGYLRKEVARMRSSWYWCRIVPNGRLCLYRCWTVMFFSL